MGEGKSLLRRKELVFWAAETLKKALIRQIGFANQCTAGPRKAGLRIFRRGPAFFFPTPQRTCDNSTNHVSCPPKVLVAFWKYNVPTYHYSYKPKHLLGHPLHIPVALAALQQGGIDQSMKVLLRDALFAG